MRDQFLPIINDEAGKPQVGNKPRNNRAEARERGELPYDHSLKQQH